MTFRLIVLTAISFLFPITAMSAQTYTSEQIKAVYLFRIANFVHWEDEHLMQQIRFCVPDDGRVRQTLKEIIENKTIRQLPLVLAEKSSFECDIVYISTPNSLKRLQNVPRELVTVGDVPNFTRYGGAIELVTIKKQIKPKVRTSNIGSYRLSANLMRVSIIEEEPQ